MKFFNLLLLGVLSICAGFLLAFLGGVGTLNQEQVSATDSTGKTRAEQPAPLAGTAAVSPTTTDPSLSPRLVKAENRQPTPADDQTNQQQSPQLAISGRVLDDAGEPIPGIELRLTAVRLFDGDEGTAVSLGAHEQFTLTGFDGLYTFGQLADGDYRIRSPATDYYAPAQIAARAGVSSADLVLAGQRALRVHGVVANTDGTPLAGVQVTPIVPRAGSVTTGQEGQYQLQLTLATTRGNYLVRFQHAGYREQRVPVRQADWVGQDTIRVDASLAPVETIAVVAGTVKSSTTGLPLAGEVVQLYSPRLKHRYRTATDQAGTFLMRDVETGQDYRLLIRPKGEYQDYDQRNLRVTAAGLRLDLVLEALSVGRLTGHMVDVDGNPIPRFSLLLRSGTATSQWLRVTGDSQGYFVVDDVPAGALILRTSSTPLFTVSGIDLPGGDETQLALVLDWGTHAIHGRVVDSLGQPVPMSKITVSWVHQDNGVRSGSRRQTVADAQGYFRLDQLGPGPHTLHINAPGFDGARLDHDATEQGRELMVQLQEKI
ncbi:MAG: carboxypeptidase-like regulatory domain-containing protein [Gammaproteobacteria bacterium]|nr:carboxypeptidase-like regulatory domain-containing protein [Gammaproteobacteria bacterium]